jgi:hypothetical protein
MKYLTDEIILMTKEDLRNTEKPFSAQNVKGGKEYSGISQFASMILFQRDFGNSPIVIVKNRFGPQG